MLLSFDMKFDENNTSGGLHSSDYDPHSESIGSDHCQQANDEWEYYRRQNERWLIEQPSTLFQSEPISPIEIPWDTSPQQERSPLARVTYGGLVLVLLSYLYWML